MWSALLLATSINMTLQVVGTSARVRQFGLVGFAFDAEVTRWTAQIPTLDHLEVAENLDRAQAIRDNALALGGALNQVMNLANSMIWAIVSIVVAASADARLLLLLVASLPPLFVQKLRNRWAEQVTTDQSEPARLTQTLLDRALSSAAGAEVRVFGAGPMLRSGWARLPGAGSRPRSGWPSDPGCSTWGSDWAICCPPSPWWPGCCTT